MCVAALLQARLSRQARLKSAAAPTPTTSTTIEAFSHLRGKINPPPTKRLAGADDEERDRDVLAGHGDKRQRMEELVVAEHGWERVRSPSGVDDCASRVGEPADAEQCDRRRIESRG